MVREDRTIIEWDHPDWNHDRFTGSCLSEWYLLHSEEQLACNVGCLIISLEEDTLKQTNEVLMTECERLSSSIDGGCPIAGNGEVSAKALRKEQSVIDTLNSIVQPDDGDVKEIVVFICDIDESVCYCYSPTVLSVAGNVALHEVHHRLVWCVDDIEIDGAVGEGWIIYVDGDDTR